MTDFKKIEDLLNRLGSLHYTWQHNPEIRDALVDSHAAIRSLLTRVENDTRELVDMRDFMRGMATQLSQRTRTPLERARAELARINATPF